MLSNAHVHLGRDVESMMKKAAENGLGLILNAGIDLQSSIGAVKTAQSYEAVYACVGVHPWNADGLDDAALNKLRDLTREEKVVVISEIGLDFVSRRNLVAQTTSAPLPKDIQVETFKQQIRLAKEVKLPIFLHDNGAHADTLEILKKEEASAVGGAIHGFNGDLALARKCVDLGFVISIGRGILQGNTSLEEVVKGLPIAQLLVETDGGDPSDVKGVAQKVAELKGSSIDKVSDETTSTLKDILGI